MHGSRLLVAILGVALIALTGCPGPGGASVGEHLWTLQFGTVEDDIPDGVAVDGGGRIVVAGTTRGDLVGSNAGARDAFVRVYAADRTVAWTRQFGTAAEEVNARVAVDAEGNVIVAGSTLGALEGGNAGGYDGFVRKFDPDGQTLWTHQFGTGGDDLVVAVAVQAGGGIVVAGTTTGSLGGSPANVQDAFVRRLTPGGAEAWTVQFGSGAEDMVADVATEPGGRMAVVGATLGDLEGTSSGDYDGFVRVLEENGDEAWTRQFGTAQADILRRVAFDAAGRVIVFGETDGTLGATSAGGRDVFVRILDAAGTVAWTRQFGSGAGDYAAGLAVDADDRIVVAGQTYGAMAGANAGGTDAFVAKLATDGRIAWTHQFGTGSDDASRGVAIGAEGQAIVTGRTGGALEGASAGGDDVFLRAYGP
ncbi:MAG: hypothetical protein K0A98_13845 [Trueperaceae bacterium]|nr:hypothetical protein [Trueperaceae bacterium]